MTMLGVAANSRVQLLARTACFEPANSGIEAKPRGPRMISVLDLTEGVLKRSDIKRGSRVLDLECGAGRVSLSIARLVGPSGLVVGVDPSPEAIDMAEKRATVAGTCYWTRFVTADPDSFVFPGRFDAVVARQALFRPGKLAVFLRLCACVRPDSAIIVLFGKPAEAADSSLRGRDELPNVRLETK